MFTEGLLSPLFSRYQKTKRRDPINLLFYPWKRYRGLVRLGDTTLGNYQEVYISKSNFNRLIPQNNYVSLKIFR